jgi:hypothetical protein
LQKIKDRAPADLDSYSVALTEALAATTDSLDLLHLDSGRRAMKLNERDDKIKEDAEKIIAAEDPKSTTSDQAGAGDGKTDDGKPKRKPPTLYRPGENPNAPQ